MTCNNCGYVTSGVEGEVCPGCERGSLAESPRNARLELTTQQPLERIENTLQEALRSP